MSILSNTWNNTKKGLRKVGNTAIDVGLLSADTVLSSVGAGSVIGKNDYNTSIGKSLDNELKYVSDISLGVRDTTLGMVGLSNVIKKGDYQTKLGKGIDKQSAIYSPIVGIAAGATAGGIIGGPSGAAAGAGLVGGAQKSMGGLNTSLIDTKIPVKTANPSAQSNSYTSTNLQYYKDGGSNIDIPSVNSLDQMNSDIVAGGRLAKLASNYAVAVGRPHTNNPNTSGIQMPNSRLEIEGGEGVLQNGNGTVDVISNNNGQSNIANELGVQIGNYETGIKTKLALIKNIQSDFGASPTATQRRTLDRELSTTMFDIEDLKSKIAFNTTSIKEIASTQPDVNSSLTRGADGLTNKVIPSTTNTTSSNSKPDIKQQSFDEFKKDVSDDSDLKERAQLNYYKSILDNELRTKNPTAFDNAVKTAPNSIKDKVSYADNLYKNKQYTDSLTLSEIKKALGDNYSKFEELRTKNAKSLNVLTSGGGEITKVEGTAWGLRNSLIVPKSTYERTVLLQDQSKIDSKSTIGTFKTNVNYDPTNPLLYDYQHQDISNNEPMKKLGNGITNAPIPYRNKKGVGYNLQYGLNTNVADLATGSPMLTVTDINPSKLAPVASIGSTTSGLGDSSKLANVGTTSSNTASSDSGNGGSDIAAYTSLIATGTEAIGNLATTLAYQHKSIPRPNMVRASAIDPNVDISATVSDLKSGDKNTREFLAKNVSNSQFASALYGKSVAVKTSQLAKANEYQASAEKQLVAGNIDAANRASIVNAGKTDEYNNAVYNRDVQAMSMLSQNLSHATDRVIEYDNNAKKLAFQKSQLAVIGEQSKMATGGADATAYATVAIEKQKNPSITLVELQKKYPNIGGTSLERAYRNR